MVAGAEGQAGVEPDHRGVGGNGVLAAHPGGDPVEATMIPRLEVLLIGFLPVLVGHDGFFIGLGEFLKGFAQARPGFVGLGLRVEVTHHEVRLPGTFMEEHPRRAGEFTEMVL